MLGKECREFQLSIKKLKPNKKVSIRVSQAFEVFNLACVKCLL